MNLWYVRLLLVLLAALQLVMPPVAHGQSAAQLEVTVPSRLGFQGESISPLQRPVTLNAVDMTLGEVLSEISSQASLGLIYGSDLVPLSRRITIQFDSLPASMALRRVLAGTNMDFNAVSEKQVVLVRRPPASADRAPQKNGVITGRVVEAGSNTPIASAQILIDSVGRGITNPQGVYRITGVAPGRRKVSVISIGYRGGTQEVEVGDGATVVVNFALESAPTQLSELVVTATGQQRRVELGHDIVVINADSIVKTEPITSVTDLLEGRVPGLVVQRTSGAPGDPARIRLRGVSSPLMNNDPIIVVDGIRVYSEQSDERGGNLAGSGVDNYAAPSPLDYIDPNSIETIQVVKGPSAATLYGQDAANGVIVITTKRGRPGPASWTVSANHGTTGMAGKYPELYLRWGTNMVDNKPVVCPVSQKPVSQNIEGGYGTCRPDSLVAFQILNDPDLTVLDRGTRNSVTLGVSGGTTTLAYNVAGSYREETGYLVLPQYEVRRYQNTRGSTPPDWMRRPQQLTQWGGTANTRARIGPNADVALSAKLSRTEQQRSSLEGRLGTLMTTYLDRASGTYYESTGVQVIQSTGNPLDEYFQRATATATEFTNGISFNWRPSGWFTLTADAGLNVIQRADETFIPAGFGAGDLAHGSLAIGKGTSIVSTVNLRTSIQTPLGRGFFFSVASGINYTGRSIDDLKTSARGLLMGQESLNSAEEIVSVREYRIDQATYGWYIEPGVSHRRLWISSGIRLDGGSTFGSRLKLPSFPKLNVSYLISDEPFFPEPLKVIFNTLRLRAAYGHAGRQPGPTDRLRLYGNRTAGWLDGEMVEVVSLATLGNTRLKPERSVEFEGGFDADLLEDRFFASVTAYQKTTRDALLSVPVAPSVYGANMTILRNIGVVRNTGMEMTLGVEPVRSNLMTWRTQLSMSRNRNVVVELGPGVEPFYTESTWNMASGLRVAQGFPLHGRWSKPILGYADGNGNGILEQNEILFGDTLVYVGATLPNFTANIHSTVSLYRGALSVSVSLLYEDGMSQRNEVTQRLALFGRGWNDPSVTSLAEQVRIFDRGEYTWSQTINSLRFNSLSVTYQVPAAITRRLRSRAMSISLQGTNLGLWTNYRGVDPNVNARATGNNVTDTGVLPQPRTWQIKVNATY